ncbi:hypothetical protein LEP1GSC127_2125 [Leptospira kirschneri str. 200801925]|nr:hypothetical protein LEP1GSC127_2125 [Leptospira kirschneri str. 200801925]
MIVIPAIDLFDNCAVRLFKGNYEEKKSILPNLGNLQKVLLRMGLLCFIL